MTQRACGTSLDIALYITCLGDIQNWAESNFEVGFALSKWLDKMTSKDPFQPKPFLHLSDQKNLNRKLANLY